MFYILLAQGALQWCGYLLSRWSIVGCGFGSGKSHFRKVFLYCTSYTISSPNWKSNFFYRCITSYLKSKTVVLVTHQIQFIKKASKILVLKEGKQFAYGTYDQLMNAGIDLVSMIHKPEKPVGESNPKATMERQDSQMSTSSHMSLSRRRATSIISYQSEVSAFFINRIFLTFNSWTCSDQCWCWRGTTNCRGGYGFRLDQRKDLCTIC